MILPRFRFLTISSKKLWIWKKLENGSPRKKMHVPWVFHFFFRGCILQVFRDPAFFRRFWPGFFFFRNRECDHGTGFWWAMTWEGRVRDPPHARSGTVLHKHRRGRFVIHNIWADNSWPITLGAGSMIQLWTRIWDPQKNLRNLLIYISIRGIDFWSRAICKGFFLI